MSDIDIEALRRRVDAEIDALRRERDSAIKWRNIAIQEKRDMERKLAAATDALAAFRAAVRLFLSGAAPCDRGSMWPRKDVMDMEAVIAKIRGEK